MNSITHMLTFSIFALVTIAACGDSGSSLGTQNAISPGFSINSTTVKASCVADNDLNNDGITDEIVTEKFDDQGRITLFEDDSNADGKPDSVITYSYSGSNVTLKVDNNNDGQPESVTTESIYTDPTPTVTSNPTTAISHSTTRRDDNTLIVTTDTDLDGNGTIDIHWVLTCTGPNL